MGGCLACFYKPKVSVSVNKDLRGSERLVQRMKPSVSEDFWTNSTLDLGNNTGAGSQGSISSMTTSNLTVDSQGGACSSTELSEFVNHGLALWNQTRQVWVGNKTSEARARCIQEPILNQNVISGSLLGSNKRFPHPIPLAEMVRLLVEVWEQEGLHC